VKQLSGSEQGLEAVFSSLSGINCTVKQLWCYLVYEW